MRRIVPTLLFKKDLSDLNESVDKFISEYSVLVNTSQPVSFIFLYIIIIDVRSTLY